MWDALPAKVVGTLVNAENYYQDGAKTDDAKVWFNKAVEASLHYCFTDSLAKFAPKQSDKTIGICFRQGAKRRGLSQLDKLSLAQWSEVFEMLSNPEHKNLASLGTKDLKCFIQERFG